MNNLFLTLFVKMQNLMNREEGQDLVEYALLVCLVALAAIAGVNKLAGAITTVFSNISSSLAQLLVAQRTQNLSPFAGGMRRRFKAAAHPSRAKVNRSRKQRAG